MRWKPKPKTILWCSTTASFNIFGQINFHLNFACWFFAIDFWYRLENVVKNISLLFAFYTFGSSFHFRGKGNAFEKQWKKWTNTINGSIFINYWQPFNHSILPCKIKQSVNEYQNNFNQNGWKRISQQHSIEQIFEWKITSSNVEKWISNHV